MAAAGAAAGFASAEAAGSVGLDGAAAGLPEEDADVADADTDEPGINPVFDVEEVLSSAAIVVSAGSFATAAKMHEQGGGVKRLLRCTKALKPQAFTKKQGAGLMLEAWFGPC